MIPSEYLLTDIVSQQGSIHLPLQALFCLGTAQLVLTTREPVLGTNLDDVTKINNSVA